MLPARLFCLGRATANLLHLFALGCSTVSECLADSCTLLRDGCCQCSAAGIVCTWPEQRKRYAIPPRLRLSSFRLSRRLCRTLIVNSTTKLLQANIVHRGPAKGYIEGLEHRLHEAEILLLQLLPVVTPDQLSTAAANLNSTNADAGDSPDRFEHSRRRLCSTRRRALNTGRTFHLTVSRTLEDGNKTARCTANSATMMSQMAWL